ncbi:energy transducer TonB [Flavobacterium sp. XGLA_31]|uniref:energy transducer TonB n=1 Tax=Flavobacterium sp. XGLA_31 TaxID=3447666 RepID=UPI003F32ABF9
MKLDLLTRKWIDIVFEGRNKAYGAYELRKDSPKTTMRALLIGGLIFCFAVAAPLIISLIPESSDQDANMDKKIVTIKLPPKEEQPKDLPPPPPPPPKVDQVKFVKPVVAKTEEITEEPPKIEEIKDKKLGDETIKGDPDAPLTVEPVGNGPSQVVEEDNNIYNTAGIEVKPEFQGGMDKFYKFIGKNYTTPEDCAGGKVYVNFVVEKDGSLTDIKVIREACPGSGKEAVRVLKSCPKWNSGEQNGKKVRVLFSLPITIQSTE